MPLSTPLFTKHSRSWQANRYVYPVISRRSQGLSIGVNLNPDQACNFDCVYCSVDRSAGPGAATRDVDLDLLRSELGSMLLHAARGELWTTPPFDQTPEPLRRLNDVAFSGDGEPTACPQFAAAIRLAGEIIAWQRIPRITVVLITNASLLQRSEVARALDEIAGWGGAQAPDHPPFELWGKLDAGTEDYYRLIDRTNVPLARVLDNLATAGRRQPIVIQSLFLRLDGMPPGEAEISAYCARLEALRAAGCRIRHIQVYTVARRTAEASAGPLSTSELDAIVARIQALGLSATAYYGVA